MLSYPQELYDRLGPESFVVMMQHLIPWKVTPQVKTPILWLGGECDAVIPERAARRAATIYPTADYVMIKQAAHNIMLEKNYREIAQDVDHWLSGKTINAAVN
jgi:alpha-beta hydrolase superfamily lysophospholipase